MNRLFPTLFSFGLAAFFASVLLLSQSCSAFHQGDTVASSSSGPASHREAPIHTPLGGSPLVTPSFTPSRTPRISPKDSPKDSPEHLPEGAPEGAPEHLPEGAPEASTSSLFHQPPLPRLRYREFLLAKRPPIQRYIGYLDFNRIRGLEKTENIVFEGGRGFRKNAQTPFYEGVPMFSSLVGPHIIEQVLKDYGSVWIVDRENKEAILIRVGENGLQQIPPGPELLQRILKLYTIRGNVYWVKKALQGQVETPLQEEPVDHFPHAFGKPIFLSGRYTLNNMYAAARREPNSFWLQHHYLGWQLVTPSTNDIAEEATAQQIEEIRKALILYNREKDQFGNAYASLKRGRPLDLEQMYRSHRGPPDIIKYPRFDSASATRQQMVDALERYGRFRLYVKSPGQSVEVFKVMLQRRVPSVNDSPVRIAIEALDSKRIRQEEWLSRLKLIRRPV
ncbi:uncharacterized protein SPSC_05115 [Sporisorium scitamineum]|uniref:Effector family protein Eff1 n=1 Tax=Sporisorium scitamineum TaxID=49012 RepID=A0A0F7S7X1_9BASI|nr:uncharacterized protein SPSC_05115 [Sporisorium scitamineum]CDW98977.1 hypothetical protein [Sporisorium scitamineum]